MPRAKKATEENRAEEAEKKTKPSEAEFEKKILELAEKGLTSEKIGEALKREGIRPKDYGKISKILRKKGKYVNPDMKNIREKLEKLSSHVQKNKQDKRAIRDRERIEAKLRRAKHYFRE